MEGIQKEGIEKEGIEKEGIEKEGIEKELDSDDVVLEVLKEVESEMVLDYCKCTLERRLELADEMATISAVECVRHQCCRVTASSKNKSQL